MRVNFYSQGNPSKAKKTYSTVSLAAALYLWPWAYRRLNHCSYLEVASLLLKCESGREGEERGLRGGRRQKKEKEKGKSCV
jgi:hypothetical protein